MSAEYEYVLVIPEHGMVGVGPTPDLRAVEQDQEAWESETGKRGTIMRRQVADWEELPPEKPVGVVDLLGALQRSVDAARAARRESTS